MLTPLLSAALLAFASAPLAAQQFSDAGLPLVPSAGATFAGGSINGVGCGSGLTPAAPFVGGNSFAGNMVDIAPSVDMTIECVDVNWSVVESIDVAVWWCPGTVVGNDQNQLGTWQLISTATVTAAGLNLPTNAPVTGSPCFLAGQTYGLYIQVANYATTAGVLSYTNGGPSTFNGTHCSLTTYYGKGDGLTSSTFNPRMWNGNLYTEACGSPAFTLAKSGTCPGSMTLSTANGVPNNKVAYVYGNAGTKTKPGGVCAGTTVSIANPKLLAMANGNPGGTTSFTFNAAGALCGQTIQAVLVGPGPCTTSNTIVL